MPPVARSFALRSPTSLLSSHRLAASDASRRSWLVVAMFVAFLVFLGYGFDRFLLGIAGGPPVGALLGFGVGSISALVTYFTGDKAVLLSTAAVPIERALGSAAGTPDELRLRQLQNVVDEMAIASGLPRPRVYVIPDPDPNAFATGRDPAHASLAVTRGLLDRLTREQLQAVIAHEMSHVRNYNIRLMTLVAALVGAVALLADWAARGMRFSGGSRRDRDDKSGGGAGILFFVVWLAAIALAPLDVEARR